MSENMRVVDALKAAGVSPESASAVKSPFVGELMSPNLQVEVVKDIRDGSFYQLNPFGTFNPEMVPVDVEWVESQRTLAAQWG